MMQQILTLNIIPFTAVPGKKTFAFYRERKDDSYYPIFKKDLQGLLDNKMPQLELIELVKLYTDFQQKKVQ